MAFSGFLALISIVLGSFAGIGSFSDDISVDNLTFSKYSYSELYSVMIDEFNRLVIDSSVGYGYYIENEDTDQHFYIFPLEIFTLYLPFYDDISYYSLYFTLDDYSINEFDEVFFNWTYDIESYCYDSSLGTDFLKSIQTRTYSSFVNISDLSSYNISNSSLFLESIANELPSSLSFNVNCQGYFSFLNSLYQSGYDEGYNEGYDEGFGLGRDVGYETGYHEGYDEGFDIGSGENKGVLNFIKSIFNTINDLGNVEILPYIKIWYIIGIPVILAVVRFALGWFR